jgi:hypothetical protein
LAEADGFGRVTLRETENGTANTLEKIAVRKQRKFRENRHPPQKSAKKAGLNGRFRQLNASFE